MKRQVLTHGIAFAVGLLFAVLHKPPVEIQTKIVTKKEIQYQTVEHVRTLPGATVYLNSDGSAVLFGPLEFTRSSVGSVVEQRTETTRAHPVLYRASVAAAALLTRPFVDSPTYQIEGAYWFGPFSVYVPVQFTHALVWEGIGVGLRWSL